MYSGQEVLPITMTTTAQGLAEAAFYDHPIDLTGTTGLTLLVRALPGNEATSIYIGLQSGGFGSNHGQTWKFDISGLSSSTFQTLQSSLSPAGDLDFAHVDRILIQSNGVESGADHSNFRIQFANLGAVIAAPEPRLPLLLGGGGLMIALAHRRKSR